MAPYKQQNPLEFIADINQKAGTAVLQGAHSLLIDNPVAQSLADNLNKAVTWGVRNSIAGKADEAATKAGGDVAESFGWPRLFGELAGGAVIPGPSVGSLRIGDDIVKLKSNTLTELGKVVEESNKTKEMILRGTTKRKLNSNLRHEVSAANVRATNAARAQAMVKQMGPDTDALNLLDDPTKVVAGLARRQKGITLPFEGLNTPGHHIGMVKTFEQPYHRMDLKKGLEVNKILTDKHNILLGQESSNLQTFYSQLIHNKVGHIGDTKDLHIRTAFSKVPWEKLTPEQAADEIAKQYWVAQQQAWKASVHPVNVEAGWTIYNALPPSMKKLLPPGFNPLDPKDDPAAYDKYRLLVNALDPERKLKILNATAQSEYLWLESLKP